ncbi:hypothetical protein [Kutzneria sp. NPDC051319]|uniref:hypothetical protein n=1 Tax=Kutzneria sp. NPDC051319 TaxID=3155047 RepID=UPI003415AC76
MTRTRSRAADGAGARLEILLETGPFHAALRAAIRQRSLTLERLRCHLRREGVSVSAASLSDWQHGHVRPGPASSGRVIRALEQVLQVPGESLARLLAKRDSAAENGRLDEQAGPLGELLDQLPGARELDLDVVTRQDKVLVDVERRATSARIRLLVRARRDGADRQFLRYFGDPGCDLDQVRLHSLEHCRLGRVLRHPTAPVLVAELLFTEALRIGDTWVVEYVLHDPTGEPCEDYAHGIRTTEDHSLLEVRFDPRMLPVDCHSYARTGLAKPRLRMTDLTLSNDNAVHLAVSDGATGIIGIAWSWPS